MYSKVPRPSYSRTSKLVSRENKGLIDTLNEGLNLAQGNYIARMDSDDICLPHRLQTQVDYLNAHPEVVLVAAGGVNFAARFVCAFGDSAARTSVFDPASVIFASGKGAGGSSPLVLGGVSDFGDFLAIGGDGFLAIGFDSVC